MIRSLSVSLVALALAAPAATAQITATLETGYDDNPFRLSDQFDRREGGFLDTELRFEHGFANGFGLDARIGHLAAQSADGNRTDYALTVGYENETTLFGKPAELEFHVRGAGLDRSFVSRNTGEIGQFGGSDIADRFDQSSMEFRARADITLSEAWTLRLQGDGRSRSYEDYTALGLSNLDYDQVFAHARLRYWPDRITDAQIGVSLGHRVFDDRRGRALDTGFLSGTDVEFSYLNIDASWKYVFRPDHDIRLAYSFDLREDNVTGYYDTSLHRTRLRYRYMPEWGNRFSAEIEYRDFTFDNIPAALIVNDEENVAPNDGLRLTLSYDRRLMRSEDREIWLDLSLTHDDFSSPNDAFNYDRTVARVGIVVEFG
ncbi:hypothetical protein [Maricaulis sp.]|uniref:hypothetical protein n=1 Tax=Maricaulis sp. TaxID=1486257 RepID=UPI00261BE6B8|nr:hypothetical protein [Maricaulis sp.]